MITNHYQTQSQSQVTRQFLKLAPAPLGQLLNQCKLSVGLMQLGDSAFIVDCYSLSDARALGQQVQSLASLAETLGSQWIFIRYDGQQFYAVNTKLIQVLEGYDWGCSGLAGPSRALSFSERR
ncbi:MAG: hypothetical protein JOZ78_11935 [Chroococcidiopsidaceae cyanobacterium CP_BM_ER_R8_30]|nr:hypothetical protein [Chroococcidiopsidaceae cyanobacterium CP_BM_ER_R8_30]